MNNLFKNTIRKTVEHVKNALLNLGIDSDLIESLTIKENKIINGKAGFAQYKYFDGIEQPLFWFIDSRYGQQRMIVDSDGTQRPNFHLSLSNISIPALIISGELATPELYNFLDMPNGKESSKQYDLVYRKAGAFFKGGYDKPDGKWFNIVFCEPAGAQAYVDYVNANYRPTVKSPKNGMRPIHPGEVLNEEFLLPLNITANKLANRIKVSPTRLYKIVDGRSSVTANIAIRLSIALGTSAQMWMNLQCIYDLRVEELSNGYKIQKELSIFYPDKIS